jgi:asparagine synthetase B (glutamine-hydrolysing)
LFLIFLDQTSGSNRAISVLEAVFESEAGLRIAAHARTNQIIVVGPDDVHSEIKKLVEALDAPDGAAAKTIVRMLAVGADPDVQSLVHDVSNDLVLGSQFHSPRERTGGGLHGVKILIYAESP